MNRELESQYGLKPLVCGHDTKSTRGLTLKRFLSNFEFWCASPPWLGEGLLQWPAPELPCLNKRCRQMAHASMNCSLVLNQECSSVIPIHRFSTFFRLLRVTSLVYKFLAIKLGRVWDNNSKSRNLLDEITPETRISCRDWVSEGAYEEPGTHASSCLGSFPGFWWINPHKGRLDRSSHLAYEVKNPILLGKHHPVTKLVIVDCHVKCSHLGTGATLAELRQSGYSVPQGRQAVNKVLASCARCKRYNSRPVLPNTVASLPAARADFEVPFQHLLELTSPAMSG